MTLRETVVPGAKINRRAADRLRAGHLWVYASDIESIELPAGDPPALLPVADSRGLLLGTALYSPTSQIALRLISREAVGESAWLELLESRLRAAIARRQSVARRAKTTPAGSASARPTSCPAWSWTSTASW